MYKCIQTFFICLLHSDHLILRSSECCCFGRPKMPFGYWTTVFSSKQQSFAYLGDCASSKARQGKATVSAIYRVVVCSTTLPKKVCIQSGNSLQVSHPLSMKNLNQGRETENATTIRPTTTSTTDQFEKQQHALALKSPQVTIRSIKQRKIKEIFNNKIQFKYNFNIL